MKSGYCHVEKDCSPATTLTVDIWNPHACFQCHVWCCRLTLSLDGTGSCRSPWRRFCKLTKDFNYEHVRLSWILRTYVSETICWNMKTRRVCVCDSWFSGWLLANTYGHFPGLIELFHQLVSAGPLTFADNNARQVFTINPSSPSILIHSGQLWLHVAFHFMNWPFALDALSAPDCTATVRVFIHYSFIHVRNYNDTACIRHSSDHYRWIEIHFDRRSAIRGHSRKELRSGSQIYCLTSSLFMQGGR